MPDPRHIAMRILGNIAWQSEVSGFCRCPGENLHTTRTATKDCRVNVDGVPTVYCFHSSCASAVGAINRLLRRELGSASWKITLPGGLFLRNGDLLERDGSVKRREEMVLGGRKSDDTQCREKIMLNTMRIAAERFKPELLERFQWNFAQIANDSPMKVSDRDPEDQFRTWLRIWPPHCHLWIGDLHSSGKPEHRTHFRPAADWYQIGPVMGNFTCGSSFKPGSYSRCNENLNGERFLIVESDSLSREQVGAIFAYINLRLRFNMHAIIDTAGKSLHGWFDAPRNKTTETHLKIVLTVLGCDPKVFTYSQPVRLPGAFRKGRLQRLIWLR